MIVGDVAFPKTRRLRKSSEFKLVMNRGKKSVSSELVVFAHPGKADSRLGLVVSKKVGNAVVRNKVKRRLREAFRALRGDLKEPLDIVTIARHRAALVDFKQLTYSLNRSIKRITPS